jgi:2-methylcitrate dehydratase PrpD
MDRDGDWDGRDGLRLRRPAIAGRLMGLDVRQCMNALALSGARDHAAGGAPWRHFRCQEHCHALVAQNGVQATILAQYGMTGPLDLFENRHGLKSVFPAS